MLDIKDMTLPSSPGVYRFYNRRNSLLYVGKSIHIAQRVRSHYQARHTDAKEARLVSQTTHIDWTLTAGEIGALLLENRQIKTLHPLYNRRQRKTRQFWTLQPNPTAGSERIELGVRALSAEQSEPELYGLFSSKAVALKQLRMLIKQFSLCERVLGLERGEGRCFGHQIGRCLGACCGVEPLADHNKRLHQALASRQLASWRWPCSLVIEEPDQNKPTRSDWHLVSHWAYLGTAPDIPELIQLEQRNLPDSFDLDTYFILQKALKTPGLTPYLWQDQQLVPLSGVATKKGRVAGRSLT